ncbi:Glyceraldehyde-3-phosphate dehydrogenase [Plecturocebus cupreus]
MAFCVPMTDQSVIGLTCHLEKPAKYDIKKVVKQALEGSLKVILGFAEHQVVSPHFNGEAQSFTFDAGAGIALDDHFANKMGYNNRVVYIMGHMVSMD